MTLHHERTRAVIQTREFLLELSVNLQLPEKIRNDAVWCLRHYLGVARKAWSGTDFGHGKLLGHIKATQLS
jgi:hypothetical protein